MNESEKNKRREFFASERSELLKKEISVAIEAFLNIDESIYVFKNGKKPLLLNDLNDIIDRHPFDISGDTTDAEIFRLLWKYENIVNENGYTFLHFKNAALDHLIFYRDSRRFQANN